tara:strand:- start:1179 stop:1916 length:738 start_codon:yes stop_codon:yes gene_type:complete
MKLLCLDIGNTSITVCAYKNEKLGEITRVESDKNFINQLSSYNLKNFNFIIVCSVVPSLTKILINYCKNNSINIFEINYKNSHLNLLVDNPSEVGNDRICNAVAANKFNFKPSIIIDFGTATTYDVVNHDGDFIGGAIAPGIDVSADYLINKTALLKDTIYKFPPKVVGKNTISNIQAGVMYGGLLSVKGMIELINGEINGTSKNIIITGGFGKLISQKINLKHTYNELLTIEGMLHIFFENQKN